MQKGTVIEGEVMHRSRTAQNSDGAKPCGGSFVQNRKDACSNPARISKKETVTASVKDNAINDEDRSNPLRIQTGNAKCADGHIGHVRRFSKRIHQISSRVAAVFVAAVMAVTLGAFATDGLDLSVMANQNAYASGTTPYTNIDVPLTSNSNSASGKDGSANNSDNANPDRAEAAGEDNADSESDFLGPLPSSASGRVAVDEENAQSTDSDSYEEDAEDDLTHTDNGLTYIRNESGDDEDYYTYTLTYADPKIGRVAILPSDVTAIAEGAFIDCPDLETIIVYGTIKSIAREERDLFGNVTRQGAFTEEQLKNVHVVFAVNYIEAIDDGIIWDDGHDHDHDSVFDDEALDAEEAAEAARDAEAKARKAAKEQLSNSSYTNESSTDAADVNASAASTPVDQGIERLSGDVYLSTPEADASSRNAWADLGFEKIVVNPRVGAKGSQSQTETSSHDKADVQTDANADDDFLYTLLSDYTLEVAWNGDGDMPLDLALPDYGQIEGTTYQVTHVAESGFEGSITLTNLTIPEGITAIDNSAFANCSSLEKAALPSTLQIIGAYAFANCPSLTDMTLDDTADSSLGKSDGKDTEDADAEGDESPEDVENMDSSSDDVALYSVDDKAFENSATDVLAKASTGEEIIRTTYVGGSGNGVYWFIIDTNGGKFAETDENNDNPQHEYSYYYSTKDKANNNDYTYIGGKSGKYKFYWGNEGYACIKKDRGRGYTSSEGVVGAGTIDDDLTDVQRFRVIRTGYAFNTFKVTDRKDSSSGKVTDCNGDDAFHASSPSNVGGTTLQATWTANTYTVSFNGNGGTVVASSSGYDYCEVDYDATYGSDSDFTKITATRPGYTFDGWYTAASGGSQVTSSTKMTTAKAHTLYAHWTANTNTPYKVNHYQQNLGQTGTATTANSTLVESESKAGTTGTSTAAVAKSYTGFYEQSFSQATINGDGSTVVNIFYLRHTYTILLSANNYGTSSAQPSLTASNGWELYITGGTTYLNKSYQHGAQLGTLPTATRAGYTFAGWGVADITDTGGMTSQPTLISSTTTASQTTAYYAIWTLTVSYSAANKTLGDIPSSTTYYTGSYGSATASVPTMATQNLERTNYNAYGWAKSDIAGTSTIPAIYSGSQTVYGNTTFYAAWSFQVRYSATNRTTGTLPSNATYYTGSSGTATHTVTTNTFTRTRYDWNGWAYTDISGSTSAPTTYSGDITVSPNDDTNKCRWLYATWKFYVGYNGNNDAVSGTVPGDVTLYAGSAGSAAYTTQNPSLTQRGYVFGRNAAGAEEADYTDTLRSSYPNKWNTRADSSGTYYTASQSVTLTPTTSNADTTGKKIVLYGQWTLINYDITYNLNGGKATNETTYNVRTPDFTLNKPVRPGYDFSPGTDANGPFTISTCGWTGNYDSTAKEGKSGYSMARTDTLTIKQGSIGQITLTANWHLHQYAISYSLNGGTLPSLQRNPSSYNVETATFTLVNPEKYPYSFQGWTVTGADTENGAAIDTQGVQTRILKGTIGTLSCTAAWESFKYNINYDGNGETGGSTSATSAEYGKSWTAARNGFTREGFEFDSWNTQANGRGQRYEPGRTYADNLVSERGTNATLYAIWKANPYTVRFNANYEGATAGTYTQEMYCGEARELTANRFSRAGYVFAGWSEIKGIQSVKYTDMQKVVDLETVSGNIHDLYAQWTPITYTVNFYANNSDASGATNPQTLTYDVPEALHGCGYIVQGYRFDGWIRVDTGETFNDYATVKNLTTRTDIPVSLYAQWTPVRYTITYVKNESNVEGADRQTSEHVWDVWKALTSIENLGWTWTGHHFDGWYLSQNGSGISYKDGESVQKLTERDGDNIQLYAQWAPDVHRVTLDARGGTYVQAATHDPRWIPISGGASAYRDIEYGDMYATDLGLPTFNKPGYEFAGWWTVAEPTEGDPGTQIAAGSNHVFLELSDQVLYARWTPIKYKVQLAIETADGGTRYLSDTQEVGFEDGVYMPGRDDQVGIGETQELKKYAKQGYLIVGWSLNRASETAEYALGSTQTGLTTEADKVVVVWAIQKLGDYYMTYYKDEAQTEVFLTETIRKDQTYFITSATVDRAGYVQTHWEIPSAGHIKYTPGSYIQSNNILTGQYELGDEIAVIPVWQKVQITVQFNDSIGTKVPSNFQIGYEDRVTRLNRNAFSAEEGDFTFEGYWTEPSGNGIMLYDATGKPAGPNANEDGVWRYPPESGSLVTLYAKWTCPVTFEFPYGGGTRATYNFIAYTSYSDKANAKNLDHLGEDADGNLEDANYVDDTWYAEWVQGLFNPVHTLDPAHEWAGWYTKPELGRQVRVSSEVEDAVTLYGCWKVYAKFNFWDAPAYSSGWVLRGNNLEAIEDWGGNIVSYRQQLIQGQTYQTAGLLPTASRAGYVVAADCWFDDPEGGLVFRVPGVAPTYDEAYRISASDVMRHDDDFDVYLEYSLGRANIKVERYLQDIGGIDYTHVEDADSMDVLGTESLADDSPYRNDAPSSDYEGFTYATFEVGSTNPSLQNTEGRVAGDGTTVLRLYYERHTFDLTLEDFWVTNAAGVDNVRGAGAAQGTYPRPDIDVKRAESESYGILSGVQTSASNVMEVWYGQTVELNAVSDAGYAFDRWQVTDGDDAGYAGIVDGQSTLTGDDVDVAMKTPAQGDEGEGTGEDSGSSDANSGDGADPNASAQSDIPTYAFVVRDSAPYALAKFVAVDVPYVVEAYFEGLEDASTSTGTFMRDYANARGADMDDLVAKTDSMTRVVAPGQTAGTDEVAMRDVAGFDVAYVEVGSGSSEGQSGAVVPSALRNSTDAKASVDEDPTTFEDAEAWIGNGLVKGDGTTIVRVFYKRCAYEFNVSGSTWADATGASGTAPARLALFDDVTHDYISSMSEDVENAPGRNAYAAFYESQVSVAARAVGHAELTGYVSDRDGIAGGEHGEVWGYDSESLLDGTLAVPEDTDGLPQWDDSRYQDSMYGFAAKRMPATDVGVTVQAQPVRATYISRYLFQDIDQASETEPASTYTLNRASEMDEDASYEIEVTRTSDDTRLLRYWIDGTDAENHALDGTDASEDAATRDEGLEVPPTGFEPSSAADAITSLSQLTPAGNETIDGKPMSVTYSKYDRKRHDVSYTYAGGPNEDKNQRPDGVDAPETVSSYFGAKVRVADTPQVNGYDFDGWMWQADPDATRDDFPYVGEGTDSESVTVPDADVAITGTWSALPYTLTYDGGTAEGTPKSPMSPTGDTFGESTVLFDSQWQVADTVPERAGYAFLGWTFADKAIFEAVTNGPIDLATGDVDDCKATLNALNDFDGNPLLLLPGQSQAWTWWKGDRTLHAVWMRNAYGISFDLGHGGWPTGTSVPLTYMTGAEVRIPQPTSEGYEFTGWDIACDGSPLEGDAPAVNYTDGDPTRAVINEWAYGNMTFTAKYDVKRFAVNLNPAGGTFDGEPGSFMDREIDYTSPDGNGTYGQATVHIPYQTEITSTTPLPEPSRPGYDFSGWTDAEGNPIGWTLDDDGNKVDAPYMFDDAKDATWVATWRAHRYRITYDFGEHANAVTINDADRFSEYFAGMMDEAGNVVTSFMLPTADDIEGLPENVGFDGWYPAGGNPDSDRMRSFDPNAETGDKEFVAVFSKGANAYTERFWLEVLDQTEDIEGRQYAFIGDTKFALDETLSVTRRTDSPNAQASMSAISGFSSVNPYDGSGVSIYPTEHPYVCVFSAGQDTVNGFYMRETRNLTVGTANGMDDDETTIQVSPASALVKDADIEDNAYARDESTNVATLKGVSHATIKWGAKVDVGVTCPRSSGYEFVAWQTDAGATPADIDVRSNPAAFTMPDANVVLSPSTELVHFKATYKDAFGKDVFGAGQATFTVNDEFALKNLDDVEGHAFRGWEAYVADEDGNKLDPEANPVPGTVGYDEDHEHMWVREGTATDLIFEARYAAVEYSVSVTLPKGTNYLPNGMPDGLPQIEGIDWVLMPGSDGTDAIGFTYTVEDLGTPLVVDLTGINCAPYEVNSWRVAGTNGESNVPSLEGGVLTLSKDNLGDWNLTPDVYPIRYEFTLDMSDVRDGYVPLDVDTIVSDLEAAGYTVERIEDGNLKVTFDVETAEAYELPAFEKEDESSAPEFAFRGWARSGDAANASNPYILPPADIASWPKEGTVIAPVWAKTGEQSTLVAHLPNDKGDYTDDYRFTFTGDALTPIDYSQDERFADIVNDVNDENVGYHLVWHGTPGLTDDDVTTLPTNFPESGTQEVWGEWVEDDDIITVGFGVKWDNSAPPGETKPRSAFALNASDFVSDDVDYSASAFSMRGAYSDDVAAIDDVIETPIADATSTYYYIPNKGLYVKDANGKYHMVTRIANIDDIAGTYAGWRLEGFYLPIDTEKPERIIIGPDGTVDNATFVEVAGAKPSDLTFTVRWARISLVEIDMVGGYGEGSDDLTLYYWPEKDAFVKGDDDAIGDMYSAPRAYSKGDFNTGVMLGTFATKGIPESKEDAEGTRAFIGYFGETSNRKWDLAKDADGNPLPAANAFALTPIFSYLAVTDDYGKQVTVGTDAIELPYGYDASDDATAYDPTSKDGTTKVTWRAAWEGDLDAIHFNATVPMSMSFMVRADGTAIGPEAGAYQIRNYSNVAISVEDVTFEWAEESELEALFGKGATDALALSATPTDGQEGYAQTKVLLERANATQDAVGAGLVSRYVFGADKWVIAKSVGMDPGDFTGDATMLPALKLDYDLTSGGIRQLTQENASQDTTHPIGTLKFTLKTVR